MEVAIIGGGAAGFFMAIQIKQAAPQARVTIYEKSTRPLVKVGLSGGGRCNLTNSFREVTDLKQVYPRGSKLMKRLFHIFDYRDAMGWFRAQGVGLVTQEDQCVFPQSQDAQNIVGCLMQAARQRGVRLLTGHGIRSLAPREEGGFVLTFWEESIPPVIVDRAAITTGGSPQRSGLAYLEKWGHQIENPVPSLFTFNLPDKALRNLMGTVVEHTLTALAGTPFRAEGPLLVTHWGVSGPAILKLSSHAARYLSEHDYKATLLVNWTGESSMDTVAGHLSQLADKCAGKQLVSHRPFGLPARLWEYLLAKAALDSTRKWGELGRKGMNKLVNVLTNDNHSLNGRGTFRDEFVTCGGISLESVNLRTLESKVCPGLFFAGEVLDVDAVTGGFNFQAAWTTAYVAAHALAGVNPVAHPFISL